MSEGLTYRCLCPEGRQLQADGKSCNRELWVRGVSAHILSLLDFALAVAQGCGVNVGGGGGVGGCVCLTAISFPSILYPAVKINFLKMHI